MKKPTKHQLRRRREIIAFLRQLPRKKFNFLELVEGDKPKGAHEPCCCTVGCVIGWTPTVFPRLASWKYDEDNEITYVTHKPSGVEDYDKVGMELFGLSYSDSVDLFTPIGVRPDRYVPHRFRCTATATPREVARKLEAYFNKLEKEGR